ncbi:MAG: cell division protein FtsK, partial [Micromonosporaceae bacterium]|nr:cell division protein FtsK [Micromonosporaceae bacterium]
GATPDATRPAECVVAAGGDHLGPVRVDLAETGAFLVAGPPRSGRSTALVTMVESLAGRASGELPVVLLCPRPSPLRELADLEGVIAVLSTMDSSADLDELLGGPDSTGGGPIALVVDDAELLADGPVAPALEHFVRYARDTGSVLIAAGTTDDLQLQRYRGWLATARRARSGLLLTPASYVDGELFDLRLPRSTGGSAPPGRGLLVARGACLPVQVPTALVRS